MIKQFMIGLLAVSFLVAGVVPETRATWSRYRASVLSIHDCTSGPCLGADRVEDYITGLQEVTTATSEGACDSLGFYWSATEGKCYRPSCQIDSTLICEDTECGILEDYTFGLYEDSFTATGYFSGGTSATDWANLDAGDGQTICDSERPGSTFSDCKPDAIAVHMFYYDSSNALLQEVYEICPSYNSSTGQYNCEVWWDSSVSVGPAPHFPCCTEGGETLTAHVSPLESGSVSSNDGRIDNCTNNCSYTYAPGDYPDDQCPEVTLAATPGPVQEFVNWTGDCTGTGDCTVRPEADVQANFQTSECAVTVIVDGDGTKDRAYIWDPRVDFDAPAQQYCYGTCYKQFVCGDEVTIKRKGGTFDSWGGECSGVPNSVDTCTVTVLPGTRPIVEVHFSN